MYRKSTEERKQEIAKAEGIILTLVYEHPRYKIDELRGHVNEISRLGTEEVLGNETLESEARDSAFREAYTRLKRKGMLERNLGMGNIHSRTK